MAAAWRYVSAIAAKTVNNERVAKKKDVNGGA